MQDMSLVQIRGLALPCNDNGRRGVEVQGYPVTDLDLDNLDRIACRFEIFYRICIYSGTGPGAGLALQTMMAVGNRGARLRTDTSDTPCVYFSSRSYGD